MKANRSLAVSLLAIGSLAGTTEQNGTGQVSVQLGWGCIDVPASYRVVNLRTDIIDQTYGYIAGPSQPRVEWSFGMSEAHPLCHHGCKTVWRRREFLGCRDREVGLMLDQGVRVYFAVDQWISFRVDAAAPSALEYLKQVVARYHPGDNRVKCQPAEIEEMQHAF